MIILWIFIQKEIYTWADENICLTFIYYSWRGHSLVNVEPSPCFVSKEIFRFGFLMASQAMNSPNQNLRNSCWPDKIFQRFYPGKYFQYLLHYLPPRWPGDRLWKIWFWFRVLLLPLAFEILLHSRSDCLVLLSIRNGPTWLMGYRGVSENGLTKPI